ncbi:MAG: hypothetical protein GY851_23615 [bacterium]|nr:hypothetical protein [bacterium]
MTSQQNAATVLPRWASSLFLGLCAFTSGGAVMIYEFVAVRVLQRDFGSLLDVWACEIAVCMAGLAVGYTLGGWLADRFRSWRMLGAVMILAAITALPMEPVILRFSGWALNQEQGAWWHPLAAALPSFPPLLALGTVMPQTVRLFVQRIEGVGKATGWVAALSTTGSIVGVLLTAMVLFPRYGVLESSRATSVVLGSMGGLVVLGSFIRKKPAYAVTLLLACVLACGADAKAEVLFEKYSAYHHILVVDDAKTRMLRFDNSRQSLMSIDDPFSGGFEYTEFFHVPMLLNPSINSALFIGLGGGSGPKAYYKDYPLMQVETVEIDPMVVQVAKDYFALPQDGRVTAFTSDGRTFLRRSRSTYGAIFMDAYGVGRYTGAIPFHLVTKEFFQIARDHLDNGGCLVYNVMGTYNNHKKDTVRGVHATLAAVFETVYAFEARTSLNTVFVAQKIDPAGLDASGTVGGKPWPRGPWLNHPLAAGQLREMATRLAGEGVLKRKGFADRVTQFSEAQNAPVTGTVYTDNYAPVDMSPGLRRVE